MPKAALLLIATLAPAWAQNARVEGRVTDLAGQPLAKAAVRMMMVTAPDGLLLPPVYVSYSDAAGAFVFEDIDPNRYQLSVERAAYVRYQPSGTIDLGPGQILSGIVVKMTPEGVISGRVTDEEGDPYPNAAVLLCRWNFQGGHRRLVCNGVTASGPDGSFVIGNLTAGRYYLGAQDVRNNGSTSQREIPGRKGPDESFVTTYYPGVTELSSAAALDLTTGAQLRGMEFRLRRARVFRIAGQAVTGPSGAVNPVVSLLAKDQDGTVPRNSVPVTTGAFEFNRLLPGAYIVSASARPDLFGRQVVNVGGGNVEDVVVQLTPAPEIAVRLRTEDSGTPLPQGVRMTLNSTEENIANTARQLPDGTLLFSRVQPSVYRIAVEASDEGVYAKSMRFGEQDVSRKPLDVTSGVGGILEVVLSPQAAEVRGTTTPGVAVTLWEGPDFVRSTLADANGSFRFTRVPPGEYRLAAWEKIDPGFSDLPEFLARFEERATRLQLSENEHQSTDPVLIDRNTIEVEANKLR